MTRPSAAFCNKIWNSYRLVKGFSVDAAVPQSEASKVAVKWFGEKLKEAVAYIEDCYAKFRISDALMTVYKLFWDDYCSWYLELIKPAFVDGKAEPIDAGTYEATLSYFEALLELIHPVMPFITEELWQDIKPRKEGETIMYAQAPVSAAFDEAVLRDFAIATETVNAIRGVRSQKNIAPKESLSVNLNPAYPKSALPVVEKLANVRLAFKDEVSEGQGISFLVRTFEGFIALNSLVNVEEEIAKLEKDLAYQQSFLEGVRKKLSNERFVSNAPAAVIENERKKEADALSRIESILSQLKSLK